MKASTDRPDSDTAISDDESPWIVQNITGNHLVDSGPTTTNPMNLQNSTELDGSVEGHVEEDATVGAQENDIDHALPISKDWKLHKRELDRITAAIERASAVTDGANGQSQDLPYAMENIKRINLSFRSNVWYKIPGDACCTWERMETLLRTWFQHDEEGLRDLDRGNYTLKTPQDDLILPQFWEKVVSQDANISFSRTAPSAPSTRSASPVATPKAPRTTSEPEYENRIRYTIKYLRKSRYDDGGYDTESGSDTNNTYDEPVGFEVEDFQEDLPALEEMQEVVSPRYAPSRRKGKKEGENDKKKIRLRPYDRLGNTRLKINSPFLLNVIRSVIAYSSESPDNDKGGLTDGIFEHPYRDLYLNFGAIQDYKLPTNHLRMRHSSLFNSKFDEHMELLQRYLEGRRGVPFEEAKSKWAKPKPVTSFASLWLLLKPGCDVYARETDGSLNAYVVDSVKGGVIIKEGRKSSLPYLVKVWHLIHGASTIRPWMRTIEINVFDNDREISSLPVFPVRFRDEVDGGETKKRLIMRGQKYFRYSKRPTFLEYSGNGLKVGKSYKRARVVVEHASQPWEHDDIEIYECGPHCPIGDNEFGSSIRIARCECQECQGAAVVEDVHAMPFSDYRNIDPKQTGALMEHQYMLMSSHMFAFILKDRTYDLLDVDLLKDAEMNETAIDKLVMDAGNKDIIKAIAKIYTATDTDNVQPNNEPSELGKFKRFSADFISGKGEGQIILLHGPPGTGKTLTAESVAEYTKRPLLNITAADLGHEPQALEKSLLRYFRRATDWDAIVLLDEADVYLEQRSVDDLRRNSIVSVFLRAMDYFQGILFLTTNRIGQFDEAFASRIHLSLGYKKLDDKARGQIWDNLFQKLTEDYRKKIGPQIDFSISAKEYVKLQRVMDLEWNGREIRNAFQTAVALAVYDVNYKNGGSVPYLTENHLEQVVSMSTAFKDYMKGTHQGMTESERAAFHGLRNDSPTDKSRPIRGRRAA